MLNRRQMALRAVLLLGMWVFAAPVLLGQEQDSNPPVFESITISTTADCATPWAFDDTVLCPHEELDQLWICIEVSDADFAEDDSDEALTVSVISEWQQFAINDTLSYGPEPPPVPTDDENFGYGPYFATNGTTAEIRIPFFIPEFSGRNQARLRDLINYDVLWSIEILVTDEDTVVSSNNFLEDDLFVCAIENPARRPGNPPPFADAGADQMVEVGSTVTLDATRTFDGSNVGFSATDADVFEKDTLTYTWEWISGPVRVDPVANEVDDGNATVEVTLDEVGTYVYRVAVVDGVNPVPSTDSVQVVVRSAIPENNAPRASILAVDPVVVGATVELNGTGSSDPDGDRLTYAWRQTDELGGSLAPGATEELFQPLRNVDEPIASFQATAAGTYYFRLFVTDEAGLTNTDTVSVQVVEGGSSANGLSATRDAAEKQTVDQAAQDVPAGGNDVAPSAAACGGSVLPLAMLPVCLWLMRGRLR